MISLGVLCLVALRKESVDRNYKITGGQMPRRWSLSARRAWIEISASGPHGTVSGSLSARRAWIEIPHAAYAGSTLLVALRKESVDRNHHVCQFASAGRVALRKESVDRNTNPSPANLFDLPSLSARRAWIEIGRAL